HTQGGNVSISCAIDSGHADFCGHIHEQLVTAGRYTVGEFFDGIRVIDLVLADLVLESEENHDGLSWAKWQIWGVSRSGTASWSCRRRRYFGNSLWLSGRNSLGVIRGSRCRFAWLFRSRGGRSCFAFFNVEGLSRCFLHVLQHDLILVALNVEYW